MSGELERQIIDLAVEFSPPWSGPIYLWCGRHWDSISFVVSSGLALFAFACIYFAASVYMEDP